MIVFFSLQTIIDDTYQMKASNKAPVSFKNDINDLPNLAFVWSYKHLNLKIQ